MYVTLVSLLTSVHPVHPVIKGLWGNCSAGTAGCQCWIQYGWRCNISEVRREFLYITWMVLVLLKEQGLVSVGNFLSKQKSHERYL